MNNDKFEHRKIEFHKPSKGQKQPFFRLFNKSARKRQYKSSRNTNNKKVFESQYKKLASNPDVQNIHD